MLTAGDRRARACNIGMSRAYARLGPRRDLRPFCRPHAVQLQPPHHVVVLLAPTPKRVLRAWKPTAIRADRTCTSDGPLLPAQTKFTVCLQFDSMMALALAKTEAEERKVPYTAWSRHW